MAILTPFLCFVLVVLPSIRGTTPEFFGDIGQPMSTLEQPMRPLGQPMSTFGQPISPLGQHISPLGDPIGTLGDPMGTWGQPMSNQYGRIWCCCRRRCRYNERTVRSYRCLLPFYPRYWNTCCKYLSSYQTSSMYRGSGGSTFHQIPPTYPITEYGMGMGMGIGQLTPKGAK